MDKISLSQNKQEYRAFCGLHPELPLFMQDWWLDVVCKDQWEVVLSKSKGGTINGVLPFHLTKYGVWKVIKMPPLTPYMGVWINYPANMSKVESRYRLENKVINNLIVQMPKVAYYAQRHPTKLQNHLSFHWQGFRQTSFYTFIIPANSTIDRQLEKVKSSVRNELRRAKEILTVESSEDLALFYKLNQQSFERQSLSVPYDLNFLSQLDKVLVANNRRKIFIARDQEGRVHAGIYLVWDEATVYNLMIGAHTDLRTSGAVQLLLWEGIQLALHKSCNFDFEGGMMPNIEGIFRAFGGELVSYHKIYKGGNMVFRLMSALRNV